jgi:hypothetical protein
MAMGYIKDTHNKYYNSVKFRESLYMIMLHGKLEWFTFPLGKLLIIQALGDNHFMFLNVHIQIVAKVMQVLQDMFAIASSLKVRMKKFTII